MVEPLSTTPSMPREPISNKSDTKLPTAARVAITVIKEASKPAHPHPVEPKAKQLTLRQEVHAAKKVEGEEVFSALKAAVPAENISIAPTPSQKVCLNLQIVRYIAREHARSHSNFDLIVVTNMVNSIIEGPFESGDLARLLEWARLDDRAIRNILHDLKPALELYESVSFKAEYGKLLETLKQIQDLTNANPKNLQAANKKILMLMRKALDSRAYQLIKHAEGHPAVTMIHRLCLASYAEPKVMHAFHKLGKSLHQNERKGAPLNERLKEARDDGYMRGLIKNDKSLRYVASYFKQLVGAFLSTKAGKKLGAIFGKAYDPRGELGNNTGALYDETMKVGDKTVTLRTVYTPSPTIGDKVAPEAKGILQAMENRKFMSKESLQADPYPYVVWNYTNLQDIASSAEGKRSARIMRLNDEFPLSFRGITVTQDSRFYRAGVHGHNEKKIQQAIHDENPIDERYTQTQLAELIHDSNFTFAKRRKNPGGGYYFHVKGAEKEQWKKECKAVVDRAFDLVKNKQPPEGITQEQWNWYQKAAFRELVLMGVVKLNQEKTAEDFADTGGKVMVTNACKENIDRGGKTNACFLWALGGDEEDVVAAFHSRALLGRYRLVLPDRVEPFYALTRVVPKNEVHAFLNAGKGEVELKDAE